VALTTLKTQGVGQSPAERGSASRRIVIGNQRVDSVQNRISRQRCCGSQTSCVRQKICFERATAFSLPLLLKKGGEGWGEEVLLFNFPSLRLSPRSFLAGRERQHAASVLRAEHNWQDACPTLPISIMIAFIGLSHLG